MGDVSLHTFVHASRLAYAPVSYIRYEHVNGQISVALVTANAKVTRIKSVSITRLELMAAVLGVRLTETVSEKMEIPLSQHTLWSESMDVIYWIQGHSRRLKPFVANRVAEIQRKSDPAQWRHVPGEQNPADDATRGLDLKNLSAKSRWLQGPAFLHEGETSWPSESRLLLSDCSEEGKQELAKINLSFQCKHSLPLFDIQRFSSWRRLLKVTAWILRFISRGKRARHQKSQETGNRQNDSLEKVLGPEETSNAERYWVRETQRERFSEELTTLIAGGSVLRSSPLWRLSPFVDSDGILRVDGRLEMSNLPYDDKHPVILPKKHHISKLVIAHIHNQDHHNLGVNFTLAGLRQRYWIADGRKEIKRWKRECNVCKPGRRRRGEKIMALLPKARLGTSLRCFAHCGVDFAGPFVIKLTRKVTAKRRRGRVVKGAGFEIWRSLVQILHPTTIWICSR